jgi:hypothetical protein
MARFRQASPPILRMDGVPAPWEAVDGGLCPGQAGRRTAEALRRAAGGLWEPGRGV